MRMVQYRNLPGAPIGSASGTLSNHQQGGQDAWPLYNGMWFEVVVVVVAVVVVVEGVVRHLCLDYLDFDHDTDRGPDYHVQWR